MATETMLKNEKMIIIFHRMADQAFLNFRTIVTSYLDEVLTNPKYRQKANKMREANAKTNGLEAAAALLEQAFNLSPARELASASVVR